MCIWCSVICYKAPVVFLCSINQCLLSHPRSKYFIFGGSHGETFTDTLPKRYTKPHPTSRIVFWPNATFSYNHDDVIKWWHVLRYWTFVRGTHRSPVNSPHKGQWRGALVFSLINNRDAGDLRCNYANYNVTVIYFLLRTDYLNCDSAPNG